MSNSTIAKITERYSFNDFANRVIFLFAALAFLSLVGNILGIESLTVLGLDETIDPPFIDAYFIAIYVGIGLLSLQNAAFFMSTREPAFLAYCVYISAIVVQIIFYEQLYLVIGIELPEPWRFNMRQSTGVLAVVFMFQFARVLLNTESKFLDGFLRASIIVELVSAFGLQLGFSSFYIADFLIVAVMGLILIIYCSPLIGKRDSISLMFSISFAFHYLGYFLSTATFLFPDLVLPWFPAYNNDPFTAGRAIWVGGLTFEALFMSVAAYLYFRSLKSQTIDLTLHTNQLELAISKAKQQIAELENNIGRSRNKGKNQSITVGLRQVVETYAAEQFLDVTFLTKVMAMSPSTLARRLKKETGMSPVVFIRHVRLERARSLMEVGEVKTVREAANAAGFISHGRFSNQFEKAFNELPAKFLSRLKT